MDIRLFDEALDYQRIPRMAELLRSNYAQPIHDTEMGRLHIMSELCYLAEEPNFIAITLEDDAVVYFTAHMPLNAYAASPRAIRDWEEGRKLLYSKFGVIDLDHRNRGLATASAAYMDQVCAERGYVGRVISVRGPHVSFYERVGYVETGIVSDDIIWMFRETPT